MSHSFTDDRKPAAAQDVCDALDQEAARLEALRSCGILDTPDDESFNRLTRLASILTGLPIAAISLIDEERQWLKSQVGLGEGNGQQTPRSLSFCTHALAGDKPLVVHDALADRRFADNPLVRGEPHIRFYAGMPLVTSEGQRIGSFCIMDRRPHAALKEQHRRILMDFAAVAMDLIESRREERRRREVEEDLAVKAVGARRQSQLVQTTLDTIDQGLTVCDKAAGLVMTNRAFRTLYGLPDALCRPGTPFASHIRHHLRLKGYSGDIEAEIARLLALVRNPLGSILYIKTSKGRTMEIRTHSLADGGFVTTHSDITQMRTTEKELRRQEKMKDEFISSISHELRTPLTSLGGALGVLACGGGGLLPGKAQRLVAIAEANNARLIRLVNDLLDFERMVQGEYRLNPATADIGTLLQEAIATMEPYAEGYGVGLELACASGLSVMCDAERIGQVVLNLLSNAVKFSPSGSVVKIKAQKLVGKVRVEVADSGCGIPKAFHDRIFDKFAQADRSDSRREGSGLGLSIAKMIVEAHRGAIGFESQEGTGSVFWFDLPA